LATPTIPDSFDTFWTVYPRHQAKADARKAWQRLNPSPELVERIIAALTWQREQESWQRDDGQYIPLPASWIRGERWEDERRGTERRASEHRDVWVGMIWPCEHHPECSSRFLCYRRQQADQFKAKAS
jgi:hypothetical protein